MLGGKTLRGARGMLVAATFASASMFGAAQGAPSITNGTVTSFDGAKIAYTLFVPDGASVDSPVPVIFMTHGWGGKRSTTAGGTVGFLISNGYAVLTWDARGFGGSGGEANVDSQEYEVRDVQALMDLAGSTPAILKDGPGDPRMGMLGGSYAGGIQLATASADHRVDAIAPEIAWNDLPRSLKPNGVFKLGWDTLLYGAGLATAASEGLSSGETGAYAPQIHQSFVEGYALNEWSESTYKWFEAKSPRTYLGGATLADGRTIPGIAAPTLIIQGTKDTLFPLQEGIKNYEQIRARGVPAAMVWFCGGHTIAPVQTSCSPGANQGSTINAYALQWFDRYVRNKGSNGPQPINGIVYQSQSGTWEAPAVSLPSSSVTATQIAPPEVFAHAVAPTNGQAVAADPDRTGTAFRLEIDGVEGETILGLPRVKLNDVMSTAHEAYFFFKLVDRDDATGAEVAIDDQVTPVKVTWALPTRPTDVSVELNGYAWEVRPGHSVFLEITTTSSDYATSRVPSVSVVQGSISIDVPVLS